MICLHEQSNLGSPNKDSSASTCKLFFPSKEKPTQFAEKYFLNQLFHRITFSLYRTKDSVIDIRSGFANFANNSSYQTAI